VVPGRLGTKIVKPFAEGSIVDYNNTKRKLRQTMTHTLKEYPENFRDLVMGNRSFELRQDDRDFVCGDYVVIREFLPINAEGVYTGKQVQRQIEKIYTHEMLPGIMPGFVALQLSSGFYS
jgi:hypothetical protein